MHEKTASVVNSAKIENHPIFQYCYFCVGRSTKYFALKFYSTIENIIVNIRDFFQNFLKIQNVDFTKLKFRLHGARPLKPFFTVL
jgi:hypothetical protein